MWETLGLTNEDILWTAIAFNGGIAGQQLAPCGAVSASAVCLGLLHRYPLSDKQKSKQARLDARADASRLVNEFKENFGSIICRDLIGVDFSDAESYRAFRAAGIGMNKCNKYVEFIIEKLYEFDAKKDDIQLPKKVILYTQPGCPFCADAIKDLKERGVSYEEISIENNPQAIEDVKRLSNGTGIVPILVDGDEVKVGFGGG